MFTCISLVFSPVSHCSVLIAGVPLPIPLNVESESKHPSSNAAQQKNPSVKTLSFSPSTIFHDKQHAERRLINVSIPLSKTHQQSEKENKEDVIVRQPSPPPPSPDNQVLHTDNRPSSPSPPSPDNQVLHTDNRLRNDLRRSDVQDTYHSNDAEGDNRPCNDPERNDDIINDNNDITFTDQCETHRAAQDI